MLEENIKINLYFIWGFIAILFELGKYVFLKIALEDQINVHLVQRIFRGRGKFISGFLESFSIFFLRIRILKK